MFFMFCTCTYYYIPLDIINSPDDVELDVVCREVEDVSHLVVLVHQVRLDRKRRASQFLRDPEGVHKLHAAVSRPAHQALEKDLGALRLCPSVCVLPERGDFHGRIRTMRYCIVRPREAQIFRLVQRPPFLAVRSRQYTL